MTRPLKFTETAFDILLDQGDTSTHELLAAVNERIVREQRAAKGLIAYIPKFLLNVSPLELREILRQLENDKRIEHDYKKEENGKTHRIYHVIPQACFSEGQGEFAMLIARAASALSQGHDYVFESVRHGPNELLVYRQLIHRELRRQYGIDNVRLTLEPGAKDNMQRFVLSPKKEG